MNISVVKYNAPVNVNNANYVSNELREYKRLLDDGLITQQDYDKKKNDLLS